MKLVILVLVLMGSCGARIVEPGEPVSAEVDVLLFEEFPEPDDWGVDSL